MVFAAIFRQKTRQEGREQGREEGREQGREEGLAAGLEEANAAWHEWNRRREEAVAEGKPFDEPTPDPTVELTHQAPDGHVETRR